ncbi:unnamed protein product [Cylindrotheca closterium]|uniref:Uncharacterized protein n=1 Tax=Cylindrotheca closterium TaxID=2856 RepID=A0AAD2JGY0_9STRA|nr:unnamed protein product [Cylindrotheca closterium]
MIFRKRQHAIYQEPNVLESVAQYHHLFRLPILSSPTLPSTERHQLQVSLLREEIEGLKTAIVESKSDLVPAANAFANLQYAIGRAVLEFGMGGLFLSMFDEVHRAHMSKICNSRSEAEATQRFHRSKKGIESVIETVVPSLGPEDAATQSKWLVLRSKDHKMLKSVKYAPANLSIIVTRAMEAAAQSASSSDSCSSHQSLPLFFLMASPGALSSAAEHHAALNGSMAPSTTPKLPNKERCQWRLSILESKLKELENALAGEESVSDGSDDHKETLIRVAHCLTNMQYSLSASVLEFGMASLFQSIFDEVHRSRMSEACETVEEAQETIQHYLKEQERNQEPAPSVPTGTIMESPEEDDEDEDDDSESSDYYYRQQQIQHGGMKWLVYQQGKNKVLKSVKHTPANLSGILIQSSC